MAKRAKRPNRPLRILVTNDDGIHAQGLKVLETIAARLSRDVWVVAPEIEQSAASHSLTLHYPLRVRQISERRFAVSGTPTDAVVMAINRLIPERKPDLVLSGVNRGANLAEDVTYSGTIAAAMEGTLLGVPSIALSQAYNRGAHPMHWATVERHGPVVIRALLRAGWPAGVLMSVNFPAVRAADVRGVQVTSQGQRDAGDIIIIDREDPRGAPYYWLGFRRQVEHPVARTDLAAVRAGAISVTPLRMEFTDRPSLIRLARAVGRRGR
ncbi:MAG: 5'/3'-nucleotidase SurE [Alphaproteobacteria bacterium]|nr:5'/3'-nucleotidase SurE [Alphaproteobacteria bacterium]